MTKSYDNSAFTDLNIKQENSLSQTWHIENGNVVPIGDQSLQIANSEVKMDALVSFYIVLLFLYGILKLV